MRGSCHVIYSDKPEGIFIRSTNNGIMNMNVNRSRKSYIYIYSRDNVVTILSNKNSEIPCIVHVVHQFGASI